MISKCKFMLMSLAILGVLSLTPWIARAEDTAPAFPADAATGSELDQALAESANLASEPEALEGMEVEEPNGIPSAFGFWWRNFSERVSLSLTIDPVKKAEKHLKFAEERTKLAEYITQNSDDPKVQEKAQQMLEKANTYMERIEERKNDLADNPDARARILLRNVARHSLNKELVLEKIEDKLPPEKLEEFQQFRAKTEAQQGRFLDALQNNPKVPQEVKDKAAEALERARERQEERADFRAAQTEILDRIHAGDEAAKAEFEQLRQEREAKLEQAREEFQSAKDGIINKLKAGDQNALQELQQLNQEGLETRNQLRQETQEKMGEIRQEGR